MKNSDNQISQTDTVIVFSDRISLSGIHSDEFGGTSFKPISLMLDNITIFRDSINEYWLSGFESDQYPKLLTCADGSFQLLIEVDERPNSNELLRINISTNGQIHHDRLPIFRWQPIDLDNDGKLELYGVLTNGETIASGDTAFYNPTLVYELNGNCISLDSSATVEKNKKIWGMFYGYYYNDTLLLPLIEKNGKGWKGSRQTLD